MTPQIGDIWLDKDDEYSLVIDIYEKDTDGLFVEMLVHVLCLNNGKHFSENTLDMFGDFFVERVA